MSSTKKRPSRLGRGLSSLMAQPAPTTPPAETDTQDTRAAKAAPARKGAAAKREPTAPTPPPEASPEATPQTAPQAPPAAPAQGAAGPGLRYLDVASLRPNPHQPRQHFDEAALQRLAGSIKADGLMQPIVVRPAPAPPEAAEGKGGEAAYELVAGERRWRAARLAGLAVVPAIVRELDDQQLAEWALIENLQREDLNPLERAEAFQGLVNQFGLSHDAVAERVGLDRSTISNLLRLLNLSDAVQAYVRDGLLSMGQARAIAGLTDAAKQKQVADQTLRQGLSVRQVEQLVRRAAGTSGDGSDTTAADPSPKRVRSAYLADLEQQIAEQLQTKVQVRPGRKKGAGTLSIEFYSLDQFDTLLEKLGVQAE